MRNAVELVHNTKGFGVCKLWEKFLTYIGMCIVN